jgi:lipopolysaccharide transport system ATP-binding protein
MDPIFTLIRVSVSFVRHDLRPRTLKGALKNVLGESGKERYTALSEISLAIQEGERVGVIGRNGAGKSTLLRVLTQVIVPQSGGVYVNRRKHIVPLLELGIGFHPDLSGRENCLLSGLLMGYTKNEMQEKMDGIAAFAELEDFFDQSVRTYSSGMYARLAFALATDVRPDVLLVDEVFGVGDEFFMQKCNARMRHLMESGTTTVFVSHDLNFLTAECKRLIWLEKGRIVMDGATDEVATAYRKLGEVA